MLVRRPTGEGGKARFIALEREFGELVVIARNAQYAGRGQLKAEWTSMGGWHLIQQKLASKDKPLLVVRSRRNVPCNNMEVKMSFRCIESFGGDGDLEWESEENVKIVRLHRESADIPS